MAQEFKEKKMIVNLVKAFAKPKTKRTRSAMHFLKEAVKKETRLTKMKISNAVNETIWGRGMFNCPRSITIKVIPEKDTAKIYLADEKIEEKKAPAKKEEKKTTTENKTTEKVAEEKEIQKEEKK